MRSACWNLLAAVLLLAGCGQLEPERPASPAFIVRIDGESVAGLAHVIAYARHVDRAARNARLGLPPPATPQTTLYGIELFADANMDCARLLQGPHRPAPDEHSAGLSLAEGETRGFVRIGNRHQPTSEIELVALPAQVGDALVLRLRQPVAWSVDGADGRSRRFELSGEFRGLYCGEQAGG